MKGIVITPENLVYKHNFGEPFHETVAEVLGGPFEVVRPRGLPKPYCMLADGEGKLKSNPKLNVIASVLYESARHGDPIAGTVVIMKIGEVNGEPDIVGLDDAETVSLFEMFIKMADAIAHIPENEKTDAKRKAQVRT